MSGNAFRPGDQMGMRWERDESDDEFAKRIRRELAELFQGRARETASAKCRLTGGQPVALTDADRELLRRFYISPE